MKQKLIDGKLYFQELEAQAIDITGATIDTVYVQNYLVEAFKELNPDLNIQPYNYKVLSDKKPFWFVEDEEEQQQQDPTPNPNPNPNPDVPTPVDPVVFTPTTYSFVSYDQIGSTYYGYGKVQTTENTANGRTQVLVTENSVEGWAGNYYWVDSNAQAGDDTLYPLYDYSEAELDNGVAVKIYEEGMIPSNVIPSEEPAQEDVKTTPTISFSLPADMYNCVADTEYDLSSYVNNPDNVEWQITSASTGYTTDPHSIRFTENGTYNIYAVTTETSTYYSTTFEAMMYMTTESEPVI